MESGNSSELNSRMVKSKIRENKLERDKSLKAVFSVISCLVILVIVSFYCFCIQKEEIRTWMYFAMFFAGLLGFGLVLYWYQKYKKTLAKIQRLEQELARLKAETEVRAD